MRNDGFAKCLREEFTRVAKEIRPEVDIDNCRPMELPADLERRGKIRDVDQSRRVSSGERQQPGQRIERMDACNIAKPAQ